MLKFLIIPGKKLKGSSLISTITTVLIASIFLLSLIQLAYYHRLRSFKNNISEKLKHNIEESINVVLADTQLFNSSVDSVDLFDEGNDIVTINKKRWGLFGVVSIKAMYERFEETRSLLVGNDLPEYTQNCLYLADHKRSLFLVGNTLLRGNIYIPESGVKSSFIGSRGFGLSRLYEGEANKSDISLPTLDSIELNSLKNLISLPDSLLFVKKGPTLVNDSINNYCFFGDQYYISPQIGSL